MANNGITANAASAGLAQIPNNLSNNTQNTMNSLNLANDIYANNNSVLTSQMSSLVHENNVEALKSMNPGDSGANQQQ